MASAGLHLRPELIAEGAYTFESGVSCGTLLLSRGERPTAIFCANDEMAAGLLQSARRAGIQVPGDLSVVGFDDFQIATQVWPTLTTVHSPIRGIGLLAAQRLLAGAHEGEAPVADIESLLPKLVIRESTGPAPP